MLEYNFHQFQFEWGTLVCMVDDRNVKFHFVSLSFCWNERHVVEVASGNGHRSASVSENTNHYIEKQSNNLIFLYFILVCSSQKKKKNKKTQRKNQMLAPIAHIDIDKDHKE